MRQINKTNTISEILNTFTFGQKNSKGKSLSDTIKYSAIFSFWKDIVGEKLAKYTKPVNIKYSKLYVSAKSPAIVQEMSLTKDKLIEKINSYSAALNITVKDIVISYKDYKEENKKDDNEDKPDFYSEDELDKINIDKNFEEDIKESINNIEFLSDEQKQIFINKICKTKKAQTKRLQGLDKTKLP